MRTRSHLPPRGARASSSYLHVSPLPTNFFQASLPRLPVPALPATLSPTIIASIIRGRIGYQGVLVSDDLAMHALTGAPADRATAALQAGCDVAL